MFVFHSLPNSDTQGEGETVQFNTKVIWSPSPLLTEKGIKTEPW